MCVHVYIYIYVSMCMVVSTHRGTLMQTKKYSHSFRDPKNSSPEFEKPLLFNSGGDLSRWGGDDF